MRFYAVHYRDLVDDDLVFRKALVLAKDEETAREKLIQLKQAAAYMVRAEPTRPKWWEYIAYVFKARKGVYVTGYRWVMPEEYVERG